NLFEQKIDDYILKHFKMKEIISADITPWKNLILKIQNVKHTITIGLVGKYVTVHDSYLSIAEAIKHAAFEQDYQIDIKWIDAEKLNDDNISLLLDECHGIVIPGGFGKRAVNGKLKAIHYARINNIPIFGICLGMQLMVIEYARNVLQLYKANSTEMEPQTLNPVVIQKIKNNNLGGTLRLGLYPCHIKKNTKIYEIFKQEIIHERHRHRYEVNSEYIKFLSKDQNFIISGMYLPEKLPEIIELKNHIWFIGVQFHPEFLSRPFKIHPLFKDFIYSSSKIYLNKKNKII
ncbi:MAG: CTP synthase, partial [Candidatus Phytoplasma stylosanthis]|nr:CTP synthase [Candidatus Phytoplasma stylosanthis]